MCVYVGFDYFECDWLVVVVVDVFVFVDCVYVVFGDFVYDVVGFEFVVGGDFEGGGCIVF